MKTSLKYFLDGILEITLPTMLIIIGVLMLIDLIPLLFQSIYQLVILV